MQKIIISIVSLFYSDSKEIKFGKFKYKLAKIIRIKKYTNEENTIVNFIIYNYEIEGLLEINCSKRRLKEYMK